MKIIYNDKIAINTGDQNFSSFSFQLHFVCQLAQVEYQTCDAVLF